MTGDKIAISLIDCFQRYRLVSSVIIFSLQTDDAQSQLLWKSQVRGLAGRRWQLIRSVY
jgi:hypothetical protein